MGESERYQEYKIKKSRFTLGQTGNALVWLLTLNIIFFLIILTARVFHLYTHQGAGTEALSFNALEWFALPAQLTKLSETPWTLLTFMFAHGGTSGFTLLLTMLGNMLWLWVFGYILQNLAGNQYLFPVYIYGSLSGAVFFIAAMHIFPYLQPDINQVYLSGAQTGTTAIALAVTTFSPNYRILRNIGRGIPLWVLTCLFIILNTAKAFSVHHTNIYAVGGGAIAGFLFVVFLRKGRDGSVWMNSFYYWLTNLFNADKKSNQHAVKEKIFYNTGNRKPYHKTSHITEQRIDEILDKINQKGYHFLTDEEKNILRKASEQ